METKFNFLLEILGLIHSPVACIFPGGDASHPRIQSIIARVVPHFRIRSKRGGFESDVSTHPYIRRLVVYENVGVQR